jgi:sugar lactone lactonase YvrE
MVSTFSSITRAAELIYVSMNNPNHGSIATFDVSSGVATTIESSMQTLAIGGIFETGLNSPTGLAFDSSGILYAANNGNGTISKITSGGTVSHFAWVTTGGINGLAFDASGELYVAGQGAHKISKITSSGTVTTFLSDLDSPFGLAINKTGKISYSSNGGLAYDTSDNLYTSNYINNTISKTNPEGTISLFATGLNSPTGLTFDSSGYLYAADTNNKRINKYDSSGTIVSSWSTGSARPVFIAFAPDVVPEPSTYALSLIATSVLVFVARRNKARNQA